MAGFGNGRSGDGRLQIAQFATTSIMLLALIVPLVFVAETAGMAAIGAAMIAWIAHASLSISRLKANGDASAPWLSIALGCLIAYSLLVHVRNGAPLLGVDGAMLGFGFMGLFLVAMLISMRMSKRHAEREIARMRAEASLHPVEGAEP